MIEPQKYPLLIGQALMLEPEPAVAMVDDDNPWIEGLFLTVLVGFVVAVAKILGGLLMTASLPDFAALLEAAMQALSRLGIFAQAGDPVGLEAALRSGLTLWAAQIGYASGVYRLLILVFTPLTYLLQWAYVGLAGYAVARLLGGQGSLNQTLGAMALVVAPRTLLLFTAIPFVSVSGLLLLVWSVLIVYRGLAVAHELAWQKAIVAVLLLLALPLALSIGGLITLGLLLGGMG